jgi:hypothetical protein
MMLGRESGYSNNMFSGPQNKSENDEVFYAYFFAQAWLLDCDGYGYVRSCLASRATGPNCSGGPLGGRDSATRDSLADPG